MAEQEEDTTNESCWLNWCRLCGRKDNTQGKVKIYTNQTENTENSVVEMAIRKFFDVHMQEKDEPYGVVCETCYTFMIKLIDFAEHVTKVQAIFKLLRNTAEKPEIYESPNTKDLPEITPEKENINLLSAEEVSYPSSTAFDQTTNNEISLSIDGNNVIIKSEGETQIEFNQYSISEAFNFSSIDEDMTNTSSTVESEKHPPNTKDLPEITPEKENINLLSAEEVSYPSSTAFDQTTNKEISLSIDSNIDKIKSEEETEIETTQYSISEAFNFSSIDEDMTNTSSTVESEKHSKGNVSHYCKLCNRTLNSERSLMQHMECMHEKSIKCHVCGKQFTSKMKLSQHKAVHINEHPFSCKTCNARFKTEVWLNRHHQIHEAPMKCHVCGKQFTCKRKLSYHKAVHVNERPFSCKICNARFKSGTVLNRHHQIHEGSKLKCDVCGKQFTEKAKLRKHKLVHSEERPFTCTTCNVSFKTNRCLIRHSQIHEKPSYVCKICGKKVKTRRSLLTHQNVHSTFRKYKCTICNYATKEATALRYHLLTHTNLRPPFNCKYCNKDFPYPHTVKNHKMTEHPEEYDRDEDKSSRVSKCPTLQELRELVLRATATP